MLNAKRYIRTNFKLEYFIIFLYNFNLKFTVCQWNLKMKQNTRLTLKGSSEPTSSWYIPSYSSITAKYTLNAKRYIRTNFKLEYVIIFLYNFNLKFTFCQWNLKMKQNTRLTVNGTSEPTSSWIISSYSCITST